MSREAAHGILARMNDTTLDENTAKTIADAWARGDIVIAYSPAIGASQGRSLFCIAPRQELEERLRLLLETPHNLALTALRRDIDLALREGSADYMRTQPFLRDLLSLAAHRLTKGESALEGSGIASLGLRVSPDKKKPWPARGMLDPALTERLVIASATAGQQ